MKNVLHVLHVDDFRYLHFKYSKIFFLQQEFRKVEFFKYDNHGNLSVWAMIISNGENLQHFHSSFSQTYHSTVSSRFSYPAILALLSLVSLLALDFRWAKGMGNSFTSSLMLSSVTSLHLRTMDPSGALPPKQNGRNHGMDGKSWKQSCASTIWTWS